MPFHTFGEAVNIMNTELQMGENWFLFSVRLTLCIRLDDISLGLVEPQFVHL